jgi:hypothetical protein
MICMAENEEERIFHPITEIGTQSLKVIYFSFTYLPFKAKFLVLFLRQQRRLPQHKLLIISEKMYFQTYVHLSIQIFIFILLNLSNKENMFPQTLSLSQSISELPSHCHHPGGNRLIESIWILKGIFTEL